MSSSLHKLKNGGSGDFSHGVSDDGTSARTRPLSFNEVMIRRKNKKEVVENNIDPVGAGKVSMGHMAGEASDDPLAFASHSMEDTEKESSRKNVIKENKPETNADKRCRKPECAVDPTRNKNVINDTNMEHKTSRPRYGDRKKDDLSTEELKKEQVKRHSEDFVRKDRSGGKSRGTYEEERKYSHQAADNDWQFHGKRKKDDQLSHDSENRSKKRDSRDLNGLDKHADRSRGKTEKESKRKHHTVDEERARDGYGDRKHDSGRRRNLDLPQSKGKESKVHHEESKSRRRRSRSRELDQDRVRRSSSPKGQKHPSEKRDSDYSSKNKSGLLHSDTDRRRISSNGSSGHYRRHAGSSSGLGGYSPRKRKSDAAARTPSPVKRSPEKRTAGWDLPPGKATNGTGGLGSSFLQSSSQNVLGSMQMTPTVIPVTSSTSKPIEISYNFALSKINAVDNIQLTQATRPMRRLYIENLPASASEKAVMEWINNSLMSLGVNFIHGTQPCISCMINKEKGQALLEFLTPEDASAALSFDGSSFSGAILKVRRPKDFVDVRQPKDFSDVRHPKDFSDVTTGVAEKSSASGSFVSDFVEDSPNKIFIGGISKVIASEMLMEVAKAFGPLKAYHFEVNADRTEPCAFLEYADHSVTLKACAGLNGMKLGGKVLTVVQAVPDDSQVVNAKNHPFYGIPEHAKPLLQKATQVLMLRNVLDPESQLLLPEAEVDEILEDIRLECSRFGTVQSINVVKQSISPSSRETFHIMGNSAPVGCELHKGQKICEREAEINYIEVKKTGKAEPRSSCKDPEGVDEVSEVHNKPSVSDASNPCEEPEGAKGERGDCFKEETCEPTEDGKVTEDKDPVFQEIPVANSGGFVDQHSENCDEIAGIKVEEYEMKRSSSSEDLQSQEKPDGSSLNSSKENLDTSGGGAHVDTDSDTIEFFEPGSVLVEFKREEAACKAAHCLHRRLFDNRIITVQYVDLEVYRKRYPK